jgi:3-oxoacyl-[acyl-carrier protein] reductase
MPVDVSPLAGKVAIVAGGARGIRLACALRLADLGARVAILDVSLAGAATYGEQLSADTIEDELRALSRDGLGLEVDLAQTATTELAVDTVA